MEFCGNMRLFQLNVHEKEQKIKTLLINDSTCQTYNPINGHNDIREYFSTNHLEHVLKKINEIINEN